MKLAAALIAFPFVLALAGYLLVNLGAIISPGQVYWWGTEPGYMAILGFGAGIALDVVIGLAMVVSRI